jgi:hypothetical protein
VRLRSVFSGVRTYNASTSRIPLDLQRLLKVLNPQNPPTTRGVGCIAARATTPRARRFRATLPSRSAAAGPASADARTRANRVLHPDLVRPPFAAPPTSFPAHLSHTVTSLVCKPCKRIMPWQAPEVDIQRFPTSEKGKRKLSEKGYERRSEHGSGRYIGAKTGRTVRCRCSVRLHFGRLQDFSDSFWTAF